MWALSYNVSGKRRYLEHRKPNQGVEPAGMTNIYLPQLAQIASVRDETPDVKSFSLALKNGGFDYKPGQFVEVSLFGLGESPICICSSPGQQKDGIQITVRRVGSVTNALHSLSRGDEIGIRGPFGNGFPLEEVKGKDILFVGGGIGLPPLRSLINAMLDRRKEFGRITILYGARTPSDMVYKDELKQWAARDDVEYMETVDVRDESWKGNVGVVTTLLPKASIDPKSCVAFTCGPPIMIRFVIIDLLAMGFAPKDIISTLERYMKCGVGKCGHCAIGHKYVCLDGPVFSYEELREMGEE
jgi:NAD(P)H-flavin reductase